MTINAQFKEQSGLYSPVRSDLLSANKIYIYTYIDHPILIMSQHEIEKQDKPPQRGS